MKKHVLFAGFIFLSCAAFAQNKTLGVGVVTPNPNAALHVESPTANQGFILPRLTTAQRTAAGFTSALAGADNGLMVYDVDLKTIYIWDGALWKTTGQVAGGAKLAYPYVDTIATAPNNSNLLRMIYAGSATENVGVAHFENLNPNNGFSALFARSNSATNGAVDIVVNNTANNNDAIGVTTNGVGRAGAFSVNNASNQNAAIYATTNGTPGAVARNSAAIYGETSSAFSAITAYVPSGQSNALSGITQSSDPGSWAGYFQAVTGTAVYASTASNVGGGTNPVAVYGESTGTGSSGAAFRTNNASNTYSTLYSYTNGLGSAGTFNILNALNSNSTIFAGSTGTGSAGHFSVNNASSGASALFANTNGTGAAIMGNTATGFAAIHGLGTNATSGVLGRIEGSGNAIWGQVNNGGTGSAGNFEIINASNSVAALTTTTNGTGAAIHATQTNNGHALHLANGGVRVSTASISASPITTRAAAYLITSGATSYTFDGTVPMYEGDTFYFFNSQGVAVTVAGASIPASTGRTFIYMGGALRAF